MKTAEIEVQCVQWIVLCFNNILIVQLTKLLPKETFSVHKLDKTVLKVLSSEKYLDIYIVQAIVKTESLSHITTSS